MVKNKQESGLAVDRLTNGTRVLLQPMEGVPSTAVLVLAKVGSRYESDELAGISHFEEHMVFKGTDKRPTTLDIAAAIDGVGGDFNAFTSKDYTGFYIKTAAKDSAMAVEMLADMLFRSKFDQEEVERERQVILEEMNMYNDTPRDRVGELYDHLLYGKQALGRDIIGDKDSLMAIQSEHLRSFNRQWYGGENLLVSVAGSMDKTVMADLITEHFGQREMGDSHPAETVTVSQGQPNLMVVNKQTDQTHMVMGVRSFAATDERRQALSLLNIILGGNMSSRLFTEVRERRGLAYAIHSSVDAYADAGSLVCQVGLDNSRLEEAVTVILQQFGDLRDNGVSVDELSRAKSFIRGKLALSLEDPLSLNIFAAKQQLLYDRQESVEQLLDELEAVTVDQIGQVARDIFVNQGLNLVVIGPSADEQQLSQRLMLE